MENTERAKLIRNALRISRKALTIDFALVKEESTNDKPKLNTELLMKEGKGRKDKQLLIKTAEIERKWKLLFKKCYGDTYRISEKERAQLKRLCAEYLDQEITTAMLCYFFEYVTEPWYLEKTLVPNITKLNSSFDQWKAKGYTVGRFVDPINWWVINSSGVQASELRLDIENVLKIEDIDDRIVATYVKDGKATKRRVTRR